MAGKAQKAITNEQFDQIVLEVYEYVKHGKLSEMRVKGVARELVAKLDDDHGLMFTDARYPGEGRPIKEDTMYERVKSIVVNWRKYLAPQMETLLIEAAYLQALKAKENPASFKTAASVIMPPRSEDDGTEPPLSPRSKSILRRGREGMGATIRFGKDYRPLTTGDNGHECADTVHLVADGHGLGDEPESQDITIEMVSFRDDRVVHGVHEGPDNTDGSVVPDTEIPPEDPVDNDSGDDMGSTE